MPDIERVNNTENNIEVFENDIDMYLKLFQEDQKIDNLKQESQSVWNACLLYIYKHCFKGTNKLKLGNYYTGNLVYNNPSNNNAYDTKIVSGICDIYIDLCYSFDKEVSIMGFSKLTGISIDTFYQWANGNYQLGSLGSEIYKKLNREREESLSSMLVSGKRNPVGVLGVLNHSYSWNMPGVREAKADTKKTIEQIAQERGIQQIQGIEENKEMPKAEF